MQKFLSFLFSLLKQAKSSSVTPTVPPPPTAAPAPLPPPPMPATKWVQSPNFSSRKGKTISGIILHHTGSLSLISAVSWFQNTQSQVSAHYVIDLDGSIVQMVKEEDKAWHAGDSVLNGQKLVNEMTIGIEIVGDGVKPFTDAQYAAVAALCKNLKYRYKMDKNNIVSHASVAVPPGRKIDPKPFDWNRFFQLLGA